MVFKALDDEVLVGLGFLLILWFEVLDSDSLADLLETFKLGLLFLGVDHLGVFFIYLFIIVLIVRFSK